MANSFSPDTSGTLTTNLVSWWNFQGNSNDEKSTNNGTDTAITYSTGNGKNGQGAGFASASPSGIVISDAAELKPTSISVSLWYKNTDNPANNARYSLVYKDNVDASSDSYKIELFNNAGTPEIDWDANNNNTSQRSYAINDTGNWHHVVGTYDGVTMELWVDNVKRDTVGGGAAINYSTKPLYFGRADFSGRAYNGALDNVGIWSKVLTSTEIGDLYNSGNGNFYGSHPATVNKSLTLLGVGS